MIHSCTSCSLAEVWFEEDGPDVYLNLNRIATEEDLEQDHYLEYEGQIIAVVRADLFSRFHPLHGQTSASTD